MNIKKYRCGAEGAAIVEYFDDDEDSQNHYIERMKVDKQ